VIIDEVKATLETGGEDVKLHSKRVEKSKTTLETSGEHVKITLEASVKDCI
jgi:hypothetical protein